MKKILGLDLGTNSIGWALIEQEFDSKKGGIIDCGSRIIPMSQDVLGKFDSGQSISQTAERTGYRGVRRLRQRHLLRRERLHRVLNILGFLPEDYADSIDFTERNGQFKDNIEVKLNYYKNKEGKHEFLFKDSFQEMLEDFKNNHPEIFKQNNGIPYDWTIYYLRNKALKNKISKEELAWILLNFNQKRGYYQLRGEEEENKKGKNEEFIRVKVDKVEKIEEENSKGQAIYEIHLENGMSFQKPSKNPVDWEGKVREFIVTTYTEEDGTPKYDSEGKVKRSFKSVNSEEDWIAIKKKTENEIEDFETVGQYIYYSLLKNPRQKIRGKLIRTIERKFYKEELKKILKSQKGFHPELTDDGLYQKCIQELYPNNRAHVYNIRNRDLEYLLSDDIIFYQRPLKSKKSFIDACKFERRYYYANSGEKETVEVKCTPRSNPHFQEFRLWQFLDNLRILKREEYIDGKLKHDVDKTSDFFSAEDEWGDLFHFLNERKDVKQKAILKYFKLPEKEYRWNYVEEKNYPCNETRASVLSKLTKISSIDAHEFLTKEIEYELWHLIYSVRDKVEYEKALLTFARKHSLPENQFFVLFQKFPPFEANYCAYSEKALKKLLPLIRLGEYWTLDSIHESTRERIKKIMDGEVDDTIGNRVRQKSIQLKKMEDFKGLPLWLASYIVYNRHSEVGEIRNWKTPDDLDNYLMKEFKQHSLRNPIVEQIVAETLRVVRDVWKYHGNSEENFFDEIHIELGREMKNPAEKRKNLTQQIVERENTNQRIRELLIELKNDGIEGVRPYSPNQQEILKLYEEGVYAGDHNVSDEIIKIRKNAQPSASEIKRYKLWLDQGYISPYTGKMIQLSRLFTTDYQIEHIIPQSRFFDDSMNNKIICESEVNDWKGNMTAMEFVLNHGGENIKLSNGNSVNVFKKDSYEDHVKKYFKGNRIKIKNLLTEDVPESFIERQMNDSRYISKMVKSLLSNIVREEGEMEATSKKVIPISGAVTARMKQDWGLNDVWNSIIYPRFERLNKMTETNTFGSWINQNGKKYFQIQVPSELSRGFSKKRIDHRHHTLDAIVIAAVTRDHVNYLTSINTERENHSLVRKLRRTEKYNGRDLPREFLIPWPGFTREIRESLEKTVVSFKQNLRIINKSVNRYEKWVTDDNGQLKKKEVQQTKGDNWAIRKPLHKETVYGQVILKRKKTKPILLNYAIENHEMIVDKKIKRIIQHKLNETGSIEQVKKHFRKNPIIFNNEKIKKIDIYEELTATASRISLDPSFSSKKIASVTDTGIQKILLKHLKNFNSIDNKGKIEEHPELAFSQEGIEEMNENINVLNNGKSHQPIYKVRVFEEGNRFSVGYKGNKKDKYVEAAKGTNLFFAIYQNEDGKRKYESIPLYQAIERQKQGLEIAKELIWDEKSGEEYRLLFTLSPNDMVYIPTNEEFNTNLKIDLSKISKEQARRFYKMVSCTGPYAFFVRNDISNSIWNKVEFSPLNKMEKSIEGIMIKENCRKINIDRIGNVISLQ